MIRNARTGAQFKSRPGAIERNELIKLGRSKRNADAVIIIGANGTMGAGAAEIFAAAGFQVTMLARDLEKARAGLEQAEAAARAEAIAERVTLGTYDRDFEAAVGASSIIFESLAEEMALKREFFEKVDRCRKPDSVVATVSSGLSIVEIARGRSQSFRRNFLGIHLYNPPHVIVGCEVIPNPDTDREVLAGVVTMMQKRLGRKVIIAKDQPAFAGNRVGFKVLNEVAQLAARHGVAFIDYLIGPHTGRAMAPLATIDLVGWDVHQAIVDNVYHHNHDEAHRCFQLPDYMREGIQSGRLGAKSPVHGGFYRKAGEHPEVLDPQSGSYRELEPPAPIEFVEKMKELHRVGRYRESLKVMAEARGQEADLARQVVLGYLSYALNRVGEVADTNHDIDTIMSYGFNWAPPSVLVDLIGARQAIAMLKRYGLKVPPILEQAAADNRKLYAGNILDFGRTFVA